MSGYNGRLQMNMGNKKAKLIQSIAAMKEADYSKKPELGDIYRRLLRNHGLQTEHGCGYEDQPAGFGIGAVP